MATKPLIIATSFVKQFYEVFSKNPDQLFKFYLPECQFIHNENHQMGESIENADAIRTKVDELNLMGAVVDLSNGFIDAQQSEGGGIMVVVTGHYTPPASTSTSPFVQTFFLAFKKSSYFVSNSVFRLLPCSVPTIPAATQTADTPSPAPTAESPIVIDPPSVSAPVETGSATDPWGSVAPSTADPFASTSTMAPIAAPPSTANETFEDVNAGGEEEEEEPVACEEVHDSVNGALDVLDEEDEVPAENTVASTEEVEEAPVPALPTVFSYGALRNRLKEQAMAETGVSAPAPSAPTSSTSSGRGKGRPSSKYNDTNGSAVGSSSSGGNGGKPSYSVYVSPLPEGAFAEELESVFRQFGKVLDIDHPAGKGFAFVKYASATDMRAVLDAVTVEVMGQTVRVEERNSAKGKEESFAGNGTNGESKGDRGGRGRSNRGPSGGRPDKDRGERGERYRGDRGDRGNRANVPK